MLWHTFIEHTHIYANIVCSFSDDVTFWSFCVTNCVQCTDQPHPRWKPKRKPPLYCFYGAEKVVNKWKKNSNIKWGEENENVNGR